MMTLTSGRLSSAQALPCLSSKSFRHAHFVHGSSDPESQTWTICPPSVNIDLELNSSVKIAGGLYPAASGDDPTVAAKLRRRKAAYLLDCGSPDPNCRGPPNQISP